MQSSGSDSDELSSDSNDEQRVDFEQAESVIYEPQWLDTLTTVPGF
jgi:hypothetical protein